MHEVPDLNFSDCSLLLSTILDNKVDRHLEMNFGMCHVMEKITTSLTDTRSDV